MTKKPQSPTWATSFWEHLEELTRRLKVVLITLIVTISVGWLPTSLAAFSNPIGGYQPLLSLVMLRLKAAFLPSQATLIAGGLADTIFVMAYLSIVIGFLLASPVIFYEVVAFVKPALYENEKKVIGYYLGSFIGLLALGALMAYFLVIPISFQILIYFTVQGGSVPFIFLKDFYNWILTIFIVCGVFYTIPVFIVMLVQVGVFPIKYLRGRNKIIVYATTLILFWIFGPDPTPLTGLIMLAPFIFVLETATFFAIRIDRTRTAKKEAATKLSFAPWTGFMTCRFCSEQMEKPALFCPKCKRSTE